MTSAEKSKIIDVIQKKAERMFIMPGQCLQNSCRLIELVVLMKRLKTEKSRMIRQFFSCHFYYPHKRLL